jgi:hypothetical protein
VFMLIHGVSPFKVKLERGSKDEKKNDIKKKKKEPYEGLKSWSLLFGLNGFTHELIGL